jgi:hypothetical protein
MRITKVSLIIAALVTSTVTATSRPRVANDQSDVRTAVQRIFNHLKSGDYGAAYDALPSSARARISRDRVVQGLQSTQGMLELQRIEIGSVSVSGDLAVVNTIMYAHIKPVDADGKLVAQQYLVREDGQWKVLVGDNATINNLLKSNPAFARRFPIKKPQAFVNQNGKWEPFALGQRRSR